MNHKKITISNYATNFIIQDILVALGQLFLNHDTFTSLICTFEYFILNWTSNRNRQANYINNNH